MFGEVLIENVDISRFLRAKPVASKPSVASGSWENDGGRPPAAYAEIWITGWSWRDAAPDTVPFSLCFAQSSAKPSSVKPLDDGNFDETERGEWAVDFYAPWCSHCRTLEPVWVKVANAKKKGSKVHMAKLDAVLNPISAKQNGVRGYPTIQFIRDGAIVAEYASASRDADSIMKWISSLETKQQREEEEPSAAASKAATDSSTRSSSSGAADDAAVPSFLSLETIKENIRRAPILACGICAGFGGMVGIFMGVFIGVAYSLHLKKIA